MMTPQSGPNLLGERVPPNVIEVVTFADEIKPSDQSAWAYLGIVSVEKGNLSTALTRLLADRDAIGYQHELGWSDIRPSSQEKRYIANRWLSRLVTEHDLWRFSVMGIDTGKMVMTRFGSRVGNQMTNAYRRFYRANLKAHVTKLHRGRDGVCVVKSYHDQEGNLERDEWFDWHPQAVISTTETVTFREPRVTFVNSCHHKEPRHAQASHFVQLCDVLLGATRYVLEDIGPNAARDAAAQPLIPLLERLNDPRAVGNVNSRYQHVGRASVAFFPSRPLTEEELDDEFARSQSSFYRGRELLHLKRVNGQGELF